ncbi:MAG: endonuclease/exonuclease/phosphatase family protein [Candidatus Hydrogenedentes bacterium]|nr:endonuclease/exonuclease/phosphatase family protein [Candidatus Hydrogenedentota bacterium]
MSLKVVTYNVRGCRGLDGKICTDRIAAILRECDADVIALQELDAGRSRSRFIDQPRRIADALDMDVLFHSCEGWTDGRYGTAIFSRFPMKHVRSANLPAMKGREPRGALWAEIGHSKSPIHIVNTHLGLHPRERHAQIETLLGPDWFGHDVFSGPSILCGDFNLGRRDPLYRSLLGRLRDVQSINARHVPTWLGMRTIDFILVNEGMEIRESRTHKPLRALVASDHVPLVAHLGINVKK